MRHRLRRGAATPLALIAGLAMAQGGDRTPLQVGAEAQQRDGDGRRHPAQPLVTGIYVADPFAHVFGGRIYLYPGHDVDAGIPADDLGTPYAMHDYRVLSIARPGGPVTVDPVAIDMKDIPWASKQTWAPDAAYIFEPDGRIRPIEPFKR